jgi:hypothetical protein
VYGVLWRPEMEPVADMDRIAAVRFGGDLVPSEHPEGFTSFFEPQRLGLLADQLIRPLAASVVLKQTRGSDPATGNVGPVSGRPRVNPIGDISIPVR